MTTLEIMLNSRDSTNTRTLLCSALRQASSPWSSLKCEQLDNLAERTVGLVVIDVRGVRGVWLP